MKKPRMFSVAHLRAHADVIVAAVGGGNDVIVIGDDGAPTVVLQSFQSFERFQKAVSLLEKLAIEQADALVKNRDEIDAILGRLR